MRKVTAFEGDGKRKMWGAADWLIRRLCGDLWIRKDLLESMKI